MSESAIALTFDSPSARSSSTSSAAARSSAGSELPDAAAEAEHADEEMDVMGTPVALAPSTVARPALKLQFTPSAVPREEAPSTPSGGDSSTTRRLNFTTKECATPGRYDARHKLGEPLRVYCRVKPLLDGDSSVDERPVVPTMQVESETSLLCTAPADSSAARHGESVSKFTFTRMFGPESSQEEVYVHAAKPLVDSFFAGQNGLIFAYGITASGKTYTMQGTSAQPGLIPRIVLDLFQKVMGGAEAAQAAVNAQAQAAAAAAAAAAGEAAPAAAVESVAAPLQPGQRFTVKASYLEVYNGA